MQETKKIIIGIAVILVLISFSILAHAEGYQYTLDNAPISQQERENVSRFFASGGMLWITNIIEDNKLVEIYIINEHEFDKEIGELSYGNAANI